MANDILEDYAKDQVLNGYVDGAGLKALVVDDSLAIRRLLRRILEKVGYTVDEAENGRVAISKYADFSPNIVAMDITMPEMEGPVALDVILRNDPAAKVVMITSIGDKDSVEDCIRKGAKGYLLKPITDAQLVKILTLLKQVAIS